MYLQNIQHPFFDELAPFHPEVQKDDALEETEYVDHFSSVQPTITIDDIKPILSNEIPPLGYEKVDGKYQKRRTNTKSLPPPPRPPEYHIRTPGGKMYDFIEDKSKYKYTGGSNVILDENMDTLAHLILDLKKDVKKIRELQTIDGARELVEKHNKDKKDPRYHWTAIEEDINKDGIPDVIVADQHKRAKFVNGWTVKQHDLYESQYIRFLQQKYGSPQNRKLLRAKGQHIEDFDEFMDKYIRKVTYDDNKPFDDPRVEPTPEGRQIMDTVDKFNLKYYQDTGVRDVYKTHKPRRRTANQVFTRYVIKPIYNDYLKDYQKNNANDEQLPVKLAMIKRMFSILSVSAKFYNDIIKTRMNKILAGQNIKDEKTAKKYIREDTGENYWTSASKQAVSEILLDKNKFADVKSSLYKYINTKRGFE
ncbi:uncharacterized protein GO595_008919 [Histomonas meleagridis]|uniref:uncharacterized protein n=1 Tax=Histomonas meleagridis TaxID=135588 RepID=UPI00355AAA93|nr:hypothetical protein GO595_008919 [Histomonas meleagridis]